MAGDLQKRMLDYVKYGMTIKTSKAEGEDYFVVGLQFDRGWDIITPDPETGVRCVNPDTGGGVFYFTKVENGVNPVFDCIDETIRYNEDIARKIELLKQKVEELKKLFETESYEYLSHIQFVYVNENKGAGKKGRPSKKKTETKEVVQTPEPEPSVENKTTVEPDIEENVPVPVRNNNGSNKEEASEIDKKIAAAIGK
jgi:hypothetical protein